MDIEKCYDLSNYLSRIREIENGELLYFSNS